jgi:hypothetical protein
MCAQSELFQVVAALHALGRLPRRLNGRKQQGHQHADDRNHHEQFHQGKTNAACGANRMNRRR